MKTYNVYKQGALVRVRANFENAAGTAIDPTAILCKYSNPAGTVTTLTYGTDVELVRSATGIYYVDIDASSPGRWNYRFYSTGTGQAAEQSSFIIEAALP